VRVSLNVTDYAWPGGPDGLGAELERVVRIADEGGLDTVWLSDHLIQAAPGSTPDSEMLEAYTALGFLAGLTRRVRLGTMVTAATYREPAVLVKAVTTLDVLSAGRAWLGIGAGYQEDEAQALGLPLPPVAERFERLEETLRLALQMWSGDLASFHGRHYTLERPVSSPPPLTRPHPPILIGGVGERKTLRLVARYADGCNLFGDAERARHLLGVLERHCEDVGRDPAEITKTSMMSIAIAETEDGASAKLDQMRAAGFPEQRIAGTTAGTPEQILERAHAFRDVGIEGLTFSMGDAHDLEAVALAGETLAPVFAADRVR
jgi:F420-dependent oxidoreductase-like protein